MNDRTAEKDTPTWEGLYGAAPGIDLLGEGWHAQYERARTRYADDVLGICHEMLGAAEYLDEHPEHATPERRAESFGKYVERIRERDAAWQAEREQITGEASA